MAKLYDFIAGNWSASKPTRAGVYLVRQGSDAPWVTYWDVDSASPFGTRADAGIREFFHLEGDQDGAPTRWDDPRVPGIARKNGWREAVQRRP